MTTDTTLIQTFFAKMQLEPEIADIYLSLYANGPQTIAALSRSSKVERTRIYRLVDRLTEANLIEIDNRTKRAIIKAAPISNVRILIERRQAELRNLTDELGLIEQTLARNSLSNPSSRIQTYQGPKAIRQMLLNQLKATTDIVGTAYRLLNDVVDRAFMESYQQEFESKGLSARTIVGDGYIEQYNSWHDKLPPSQRNRHIAGHQYRHIDTKICCIKQTSNSYNDVTAYYNWRNKEIFGIEIYNQEIADSQRQVFELLWSQSQADATLSRWVAW
jgi:hypothetical protein